MRDIMVKYTLNDDEEQRLKRITEEYNKQGLGLSLDKLFEGIMVSGSNYDINTKFRHHERELGLKE